MNKIKAQKKLEKLTTKNGGIMPGNFNRPTFLFVLPTYGIISLEFLHAFVGLQLPVNSTSVLRSYKKMEIGQAREQAVADILAMPKELRPRYILWLSDDELPEWDSLIRLWVAIENEITPDSAQWDILTGLVHLKNSPDGIPEPVLWNRSIRSDGPLLPNVDYKPGEIVSSDVANLGFGLMKTEIFSSLGDPPFFRTGFTHTTTPTYENKITTFTEDCWFFEKCKNANLTIGVHTGVKIGHLDTKTGMIY